MKKWYALKQDGTLREYTRRRSTVKCNLWICKSFIGSTYTTTYGNTYKRYEYSVVRDDGRPKRFKSRGWEIDEFRDPYPKYWYLWLLEVWFRDPTGRLRIVTMRRSEEYGVIEAIELFQTLSQYQDWEHYDQIESLKRTEFYVNLVEKVERLRKSSKTDEDFRTRLKKKLEQMKLSLEFYESWLKEDKD